MDNPGELKIAVLFRSDIYRGRLLLKKLSSRNQYRVMAIVENHQPNRTSLPSFVDFEYFIVRNLLSIYKRLINYRAVKFKQDSIDIHDFQNHGVNTLHWVDDLNGSDAKSHIESFQPDILVLCGAGKKISKEIYGLACLDAINLHSSLLPKYRGIGVFWALFHDDDVGVTVHRVVNTFDAGDIILQRPIEVTARDNLNTINMKCDLIGTDLLCEAFALYENNLIASKKNPKSRYYGRPSPWQYLRLWLKLIRRNKRAEEMHA